MLIIEVQYPRYKHDCDNCIFVGYYEDVDLYFCATKGKINTVIARFSSEGGDYMSGLCFAKTNPALACALARAIGYLAKLN